MGGAQGVVEVREAGEAVTAFLGVWEMNKCPDTDLERAGGRSGSSEACWMFSLKGTGRELFGSREDGFDPLQALSLQRSLCGMLWRHNSTCTFM